MSVETMPATGRLEELPVPLARALVRLAAVSPADAADAADTLRDALAPVGASPWPEVAWRFSTLTGPGFPAELAWASRDAALRWTCEVAGPEVPSHERLTHCARAAAALTGVPLDLSAWSPTQRGEPLRWGAWLGLRLLGGTRRAKAYVELPPQPRLPEPWAATADLLTGTVPGIVWRMAGSNEDGSVELYARVPEPKPSLMPTLAALVDDGGAIEGLLAEVLGPRRPTRGGGLPWPSGVSVVMAADGTPLAVTWFSFAKVLWSSDERAAAALTGLCEREAVQVAEGSLARYAALAAGRPDGRWRHGMVGVGVDRTGGTWLQAGLRPT